MDELRACDYDKNDGFGFGSSLLLCCIIPYPSTHHLVPLYSSKQIIQ